MRYLLFRYGSFYPAGGAADLVDFFKELEDAKSKADSLLEVEPCGYSDDNVQIWDMDTNKIIVKGGKYEVDSWSDWSDPSEYGYKL